MAIFQEEGENELSLSPLERSRNAASLIFKALEISGTQRKFAEANSISQTKASVVKNTALSNAIALIYHLGFKIVPADRMYIDQKKYEALETIARAAMADEANSKKLFLEEE